MQRYLLQRRPCRPQLSRDCGNDPWEDKEETEEEDFSGR